jgi:hypothetical protein
MEKNDIEYYLDAYVDRIEKDISRGNFRTTKTEDFFRRLISRVYQLPNLENLAYDKVNTEAIDLIDRSKALGIQITAQKFHEKTKIDHSIQGFLKKWKSDGLKNLWVFFISETGYLNRNIDTTKIYYSEDGIEVWVKTTKRLIGDANELEPDDRIKLSELLKQEVSLEYSGLHNLNYFHQVTHGQSFIRNAFFNHQDTIYYNDKEFGLIKSLARKFESGNLKEYCILGNPCSGKTTFAYSLVQRQKSRKVFYLDFSNPNIQPGLLKQDLNQISHQHSLVIIDNLHENISLFHEIREKISTHKWISALYLSRYYKTVDEFNDENIYRVIDGISYYRIDKHESFDNKVSGIIWKKTKLLKRLGNDLIWRKGDFKKVIQNTSHNLLKLNIALRLWERKNSAESPLTLDKIDSNKILEHFYGEHGLDSLKSQALYTYSLLYKNDISFLLMPNFFNENLILREKGIVLKYHDSDHCYFPHKEYASLIYDSMNYIDGGISDEVKTKFISDYLFRILKEDVPFSISYILKQLFYSEDRPIVSGLINDKVIWESLTQEITQQNLKTHQVSSLLKIVFNLYEQITIDSNKSLTLAFIEYFKANKLSLYVYEDYMSFTRLTQLSDLIFSEPVTDEIHVTLRKNETANTTSIVELTHRIRKKKWSPETVIRILNSFDFSEWLSMVNSLPKLPNLSNSLSELNSSTETKRLLHGLLKSIDWQKQFEKSHSLKTDQFCKSLRELNKVDLSVGSDASSVLFDLAIRADYFENKLETANLSEYCKSISDLSKINLEYSQNKVSKDLKSGLINKKFSQEESFSNFTTRALEIRKLFKDLDIFFLTIKDITTSSTFINKIEGETDLNHLLMFKEFQDSYLNYENNDIQKIIDKSISILIQTSPNKLELLSNPKILNMKTMVIDLMNSITSKDLERFFKESKFTYTEDLFRVLADINKKLVIELFQTIHSDTIVQGMLHHELNFSQGLENLNKLKNKVYLNETLNCNSKISEILSSYLVKYLATEMRRYKNLSISDYIRGYYFGMLIDESIIRKHCEHDLFARLNNDKHKGFEIAKLFQFIRRVSEESKGNYDKKLDHFLKLNTDNFVNTIKNEDITKTLSGLSELRLSNFSDYSNELLIMSKKWIIKKMKQLKGDRIYKVKLVPDLQKIATGKAKSILDELK